MATARDIITDAAKLIQIVRKGEALDADELQDGFTSLNDMVTSWLNHSESVISRVRETFTISSGNTFTIGDGQDLDTVRPLNIVNAFVRIGTVDYNLIRLDDKEYDDISYKNVTSNIPQYFSYDNAYPYGNIKIYPTLSASCELHLLSEKPFTAFASVNTTVSLPAGWLRALKYNLAVEMASQYGKEPTKTVFQIAVLSKKEIELSIMKNRPIKFNPKRGVKNNIYTGWTR